MVKGALVWVSLDPARGAEIPKTRPCVIVSRTEANDVSSTVTVVPLSSVTGRAAEHLVVGFLGDRPIHIVVAFDDPTKTCHIVTVYEPDPGQWSDDFRTRRS